MYFGFDDISISFGKKEILRNITMDFEKGKINPWQSAGRAE